MTNVFDFAGNWIYKFNENEANLFINDSINYIDRIVEMNYTKLRWFLDLINS